MSLRSKRDKALRALCTSLASISFICFLLPPAEAGTPALQARVITLSETCPPGFQLVDSGTCKLRSLYESYLSLAGEGVGGLKTGLPPVRDGFTPAQIDLGRYLFFDPALSKDGSMSCASCHDPDMGFSDDRPRSIGVTGHEVPRAAPTLWNVGFLKSFFWDGRATTLESQMEGPLFAAGEMGNTRENLVATINNLPAYRRLFGDAFPSREAGPGREAGAVTLDEIYLAITAFEASLISLNSRYDQYAHGFHDALTANEIEGMNIFRSFVARCSECHTPPLFTNQQIAVLGTPEPEGWPRDPGAATPQNDPLLTGGFKVPTLRNIAKTGPYMHSGRFTKLRDAVEFYTKGRGHAVPKGEDLKLHWHIWEPKLTETELDRLVDFLGALTDETFTPKTPTQLPSGLKLAGRKALVDKTAEAATNLNKINRH